MYTNLYNSVSCTEWVQDVLRTTDVLLYLRLYILLSPDNNSAIQSKNIEEIEPETQYGWLRVAIYCFYDLKEL